MHSSSSDCFQGRQAVSCKKLLACLEISTSPNITASQHKLVVAVERKEHLKELSFSQSLYILCRFFFFLIPTVDSNSITLSEDFSIRSSAPVACSLCVFEKLFDRSGGILRGEEDKAPHVAGSGEQNSGHL